MTASSSVITSRYGAFVVVFFVAGLDGFARLLLDAAARGSLNRRALLQCTVGHWGR